ncbi:MAG: hypothetical protein ACM3MF_05125, partial [Anaerolineae bacterium]
QAQEGLISAPESRVKVMVIPTNEELVVAREVKRFLEKHGTQAAAGAQASRLTPHASHPAHSLP